MNIQRQLQNPDVHSTPHRDARYAHREEVPSAETLKKRFAVIRADDYLSDDLNLYDLHVWAGLKILAGKYTDTGRVTIDALVQLCRVSRRQVIASTAALATAGRLEIKRHGRGANSYEIIDSKLADPIRKEIVCPRCSNALKGLKKLPKSGVCIKCFHELKKAAIAKEAVRQYPSDAVARLDYCNREESKRKWQKYIDEQLSA